MNKALTILKNSSTKSRNFMGIETQQNADMITCGRN